MTVTISWTKALLEELRFARQKAINERQTTFKVKLTGQGTHEFLVSYAKYLIEHLEGEFARNPPETFPPNREGEEGQ